MRVDFLRSAATGLVLSVAGGGVACAQTSQTASQGFILTETYLYDGRRNDTYDTRFVGLFQGEALIDVTAPRAFDDALTQAALAEAVRPRGVGVGGAPAVLTWSAPALVDSYEEFLDSFTETSVTQGPTTTVTTEQLTSGDEADAVVISGERGGCFTTGTSGPTNFGDRSGAYAECDGGDFTDLAPGELNRNVHTTFIQETVYTEFTNEDYRTYSTYELTATARLIGFAHTAAQTALIEGGERVSTRMLDAEPGVFAEGGGGRAETGGPAGDRRRWRGLGAGVGWGGDRWAAGLMLDGGAIESRGVEAVDLDLIQGGAWAHVVVGPTVLSGAAILGRGEAATTRDDGASGPALAEYEATTAAVAARLAVNFDLGDWVLAPRLGTDWVSVRTEDFVESGGVPLITPAHRMDRTRAMIGAEARWSGDLGGTELTAAAALDGWSVLDGAERRLPTTFVSMPSTLLTITGAPQAEQGVDLRLEIEALVTDRIRIAVIAAARRADSDSAGHAGIRLSWRW